MLIALNNLLSPFGIELTQLGLDTPELDQAIAQFALSDQSTRNNVADLIENLIDNLLKLLVSAVSAFPDVAVSGTISAILSSASTLPTEAIILKGAEYVNKFLELVEKIPGGGVATDFISLSSKITAGPLAFLFGDPMTAFRNLGKLSSATDGQAPAGVETVTAELVAEARWLKIAGIK